MLLYQLLMRCILQLYESLSYSANRVGVEQIALQIQSCTPIYRVPEQKNLWFFLLYFALKMEKENVDRQWDEAKKFGSTGRTFIYKRIFRTPIASPPIGSA